MRVEKLKFRLPVDVRGSKTSALKLTNNFLLVRSEHAHASYPGLFFRSPGLSPYIGAGRKESSGTGL